MAAKQKTDWPAVKLAYINSNKSMRDIAEEFGTGESALMKRAAAEGWAEERRKVAQKVSKDAIDAVAAARGQELAKFNEDDLRIAKAIRHKAALMMQKAATPRDLRALALAFDTAQKIGRLALGATTGNTGHSDPEGGPIPVASVPVEEYLRAREQALKMF